MKKSREDGVVAASVCKAHYQKQLPGQAVRVKNKKLESASVTKTAMIFFQKFMWFVSVISDVLKQKIAVRFRQTKFMSQKEQTANYKQFYIISQKFTDISLR